MASLQTPSNAPQPALAADQPPRENLPSVGEIFRSILSVEGILIPGVILGATGYFIGWRYLRDYYAGFGLDTTMYSFSVADIVAAGWRIYFLLAGLILAAVFVLTCLQAPLQAALRRSGPTHLLRWFYLFLVLVTALGLGVLVVYVFVEGAVASPIFYLLALASLSAAWIAFCIGERLRAFAVSRPLDPVRGYALFRFVFPHPMVWLAGVVVGSVIILSVFSGYTGTLAYLRDQKATGRLANAALSTAEPLPIPDGAQIAAGLWRYEGLRLLLRTDDTYYLFRPSEVRNQITTTYGVPRAVVREIQLRGWWESRLFHDAEEITP